MDFKLVVGFLFVFMICISLTSAHLDSGQDIEKNGYIIDFGYSPENPSVNDKVNLAFNLVNSTTEEPINLTSVFVRISLGEEIIFSGEMLPKRGNIAFISSFPYTGKYSAEVRFKNLENIVEEQEFSLEVKKKFSYFNLFAIIFIIILALLILRGKKKWI